MRRCVRHRREQNSKRNWNVIFVCHSHLTMNDSTSNLKYVSFRFNGCCRFCELVCECVCERYGCWHQTQRQPGTQLFVLVGILLINHTKHRENMFLYFFSIENDRTETRGGRRLKQMEAWRLLDVANHFCKSFLFGQQTQSTDQWGSFLLFLFQFLLLLQFLWSLADVKWFLPCLAIPNLPKIKTNTRIENSYLLLHNGVTRKKLSFNFIED